MDKKDRKIIQTLSEAFNVDVLVLSSHYPSDANGYCDYKNNTIYIVDRRIKNYTNQYVSTFFHELGHIYCFKNNLWPSYHFKKLNKRKWKLTALKAEKWVDAWAEQKYGDVFSQVPNMFYVHAYKTDEQIEWFKKIVRKA